MTATLKAVIDLEVGEVGSAAAPEEFGDVPHACAGSTSKAMRAIRLDFV